MIGTALALALVGLVLSAFFSGSETGLYRVPRVRVELDGLAGDPLARTLAWLTARPAWFVATALVGNNVANYLVSLAIVLATQRWLEGYGHVAEIGVPVLLAPVVFIYGELLPKYLFLHAPYKMLRWASPWFLGCTVLFLPVTSLLWLLDRLLARWAHQSPEAVRQTLARRELSRVLEEGHEVGILRPTQRRLAQGIFAIAKQPALRFAVPLARAVRAHAEMSKAQIAQLARHLQQPVIPVEERQPERRLATYVRLVDVALSDGEDIRPCLRPLLDIPHTASCLEALATMHAAGEPLMRIVDNEGRTLALLSEAQLRAALFGSSTSPTCDTPAT